MGLTMRGSVSRVEIRRSPRTATTFSGPFRSSAPPAQSDWQQRGQRIKGEDGAAILRRRPPNRPSIHLAPSVDATVDSVVRPVSAVRRKDRDEVAAHI
ncbi:MAG: hypothetical protein AMXMBFR47_44310 [Planctomycetota bacterium]